MRVDELIELLKEYDGALQVYAVAPEYGPLSVDYVRIGRWAHGPLFVKLILEGP